MRNLWFVPVLSACLFTQQLAAQTPRPDTIKSSPDNIVTTPEQLRRAEAPPASMSPKELERRGDELRAEKAYADALDYYRAAMSTGQPTALLHNKAGIVELQLLHYNEAQREFQRAIKMDRGYAEAYNNLGVIYYIKRNLGKAAKYYKKAIALRGDSASFHSNLGTALFAKKDFQGASEQYMAALKLDPDIFERRNTGGVSAHLSNPEDRAHYNFVIAKMYAAQGNNDRCLTYLRKSMEDGYPALKEAYRTREFANIRNDPRFAELEENAPVPLPR